MKVATLEQGYALIGRILGAGVTAKDVDRLLERWEYIRALIRIGKQDLPRIELYELFLTGKLEFATTELIGVAWNAIWYGRTKDNWLDRLVAREAAVHEKHGTRWQRDLFAETAKQYGRETVQAWEQKFSLRFSALPIISLSWDAQFDWWVVRLNDWYYKQVEAGKIGRIMNGQFQPECDAFKTCGEIILIDTRLKPSFSGGGQEWQDDDLFCGKVIKRLRKGGKIGRYRHVSQSSRFGVKASPDWQNHIRPALAKLLGLKASQVRLERAIEGNFIPQFYQDIPRAKDGTTNTMVWYEEFFENPSCRLRGGNSDGGGLADVDYRSSNSHWSSRSFRPLGVLREEL